MNKDKKNISNSLKKFIDKNNFQIECLIQLKRDASNRKYYRLQHDYNKLTNFEIKLLSRLCLRIGYVQLYLQSQSN